MEEEKSAVTFLFGAGISISVGVPAMKGMVDSFLKRPKSEVSDRDKKTIDFFERELGVSRDLEELLLTANSICEYPNTRTNSVVEHSISPRKDVKSVKEFRKRIKEYRANAMTLRANILNHMARQCFTFDREKARSLFTPLVSALSEKSYPVYTTNYDYALEDAAIQAGITLQDNFYAVGQRSLWNQNIEFKRGNGLVLVKLHGSVTWYSSSDGQIEKIYSYTDISPIGCSVNRLVIAPTRFKDIYAQHFFAMYSHFLAALTNTKVLIIAGHSLRDDYLRAAIVERCRLRDFALILVDPVFPPAISTEPVVVSSKKNGAVIHVSQRFEDFAEEMAAICHDCPPTDIPGACARIIHRQKAVANKLKIKGRIGDLKAGSRKEVFVDIDAYLNRSQKPARIRAWFTFEINVSGQQVNRIHDKFLEMHDEEVGKEWTGIVKSRYNVNVNVPRFERVDKATLHIAIMNPSISRPSLAHTNSVYAEDTKLVRIR